MSEDTRLQFTGSFATSVWIIIQAPTDLLDTPLLGKVVFTPLQIYLSIVVQIEYELWVYPRLIAVFNKLVSGHCIIKAPLTLPPPVLLFGA